ncbi:MAG: hypothetical protein ACRDPK_01380 [Carbonactinosporaceae bacterium]
MAVAVATLLVYLVAVGDIGISPSGQYGRFGALPSAEVVPGWSDKLIAARGPFLFEPVAAFYALPQLAVFASPGNVLFGGLLAGALGTNVAVTTYAASQARVCRRGALAGISSVIPSLLVGVTCCVPTFLLLLGAGVAAVLVPVFTPLRSFAFPVSIGLIVLTLLWASRNLNAVGEPR